jgi:hypothetical protein
MLLHNYLDSDTYTASLVKNNLATITNSEIQSIKKRVDFYVSHYASIKKINSESRERQLDFLLNLKNIIETEIKGRSTDYSFVLK